MIIRIVKSLTKIFVRLIFSGTGFPVKVGDGYWLLFHPKYFRWFTNTYERDHLNELKSLVVGHGVAIDIGAHFGLYSLIMAKYFDKKVISFEPTPYSAKIFRKNIWFNRLKEKIRFHQAAVGAVNGTASFLVQETDGAVSNSLIDYWHSDETKYSIAVDVVAIDNIVDEPVDFIKIDAEGNELDVLRGAIKTIEKNRPQILLALHPAAIKEKGDELSQIWELVAQLDYRVSYQSENMSRNAFIRSKELFDVIISPN